MKFLRNISLLLSGALALACNNQPQQQAAKPTSSPDSILYSALVKPLTDSIALFPKQHNLYYRRGLQLFNDAPELALSDFQAAARLNPTYTDYWATTGEAALVTEKYKDAVTAFRQALVTAPMHPYLQYKLGIALIEDKNYGAADSVSNVLEKTAGQQDKGYYLKARIAEDGGDTLSAITHLKQAVKIAGRESDYDAVMELAGLLRERQSKEALAYYNLAAAIDSSLAEPYYEMGQFYEEQAKPQDAIKAYQQAILMDPSYEEAYLSITDIFIRSNKWKEGKHYANLAARSRPNSATAYYYRGLCAENLGDKAAAKEDYTKALNFRRNYSEAAEALQRVSK